MGILKVKCPATNALVAKLDKAHAQEIGFTSLAAYKETYNVTYATLQQRSMQKIRDIYNLDYTRWVVGYETDGGMVYATKKYNGKGKSAVKFPLGATQFYDHFNGSHPLAVFAYGNASTFLTLDIDTKEKASTDVRKVVDVLLTAGIERKDIHVSFSGSKGYHVTLFCEKVLPISVWHKLGDFVRLQGGFTEHDVEYRPNETNGHAVKLPLTLHPKTRLFAGYCDDNYEVLSEQASHDYLFDIKPMQAGILTAIIEAITLEQPVEVEVAATVQAVEVVDERLFQTADEKNASAIRILSEGLVGTGTRWKAMRNTLIPYIKCEMGCDAEETRDILYGFCEQEYEAGRSTTEPAIAFREVDDLIENFYPLVTAVYSVKRDILVSREEVEWVVSVVENGGSRASRDLLWALLLMRKTYGAKDGTFFASREQIQKLLSKPRTISPATIQKSRDWLADNGYITYQVPQFAFVQRKATTYSVEFNEPEDVNVLGQVTFEQDGDARGLLHQIADHLYTKMDIRRLKLR